MDRYGFSEAVAKDFRSCFDIVSSRNGRITFVKVVENIDSLTMEDARALDKLGDFFDANRFIVFRSYKGRVSPKGTSFTRHGMECVSERDFESVLNGTELKHAERFTGAKYRVDAAKLRELRRIYNISIRKLSESVGVSKDSIHRYEKGDAYATGESLKRLEKFFNVKLSYGPTTGSASRTERREHVRPGPMFVKRVTVGSPPFSVLAKGGFRYEIGPSSDTRTMKKLAAFYRRAEGVLDHDYMFFISGSQRRGSIDGTPVLSRAELSRIEDEGSLIELITSRRKR